MFELAGYVARLQRLAGILEAWGMFKMWAGIIQNSVPLHPGRSHGLLSLSLIGKLLVLYDFLELR